MKKLETRKIIDYDMAFEHLLCQVLGRKMGYQTASYVGNLTLFKKYIKRVIEKMKKDVDELNADNRLKEVLIFHLDYLREEIKKLRKDSDKTTLFIETMMIISNLLGYAYLEGKKYRIPIFSQTLDSMIIDKIRKGGGDWFNEFLKTKRNLIRERINVVKSLLTKGLKSSEIAFILKTSDYEIKKIILEEKIKINKK